MSDGQFPNSGSLFRVPEEKLKSDRHPPYDGKFEIICPHCNSRQTGWLNAWVNEAKSGAKYFSIKFKFRDKSDA